MAEKPININSLDTERIIPMQPPSQPVTIEQWREVIKINFSDTTIAAEVALSVTAQLLINDICNPFPLIFIGPPASGKTTTLNFFSDLDGVSYRTDKFSSAAFVSNAMNVKTADLPERDLLPRLRHRLMIVCDMATLFSKREENIKESFGTLTRIFDGEGLKTDSGPHGERGYSGDYSFMFLGASTPIQSSVWRMMGGLGSRIFFLNFHCREKANTELAEQLGSLPSKTKELTCKETTRELIRTLWHKNAGGINWDRSADPIECRKAIAQCAQLLACMRAKHGTLEFDTKKYTSRAAEYEAPVKEQPDRLSNLLYNFARGHAVVCGRHQLSMEDIWFVALITLDSAPPARTNIVKKIIENGGVIKTVEIEQVINHSKPDALRTMEILINIGVCEPTTITDGVGRPNSALKLKDNFSWFLTSEFQELINQKY